MIVIDEKGELVEWLDSFSGLSVGRMRIDPITFELASGLETEIGILDSDVLSTLNPITKSKLEELSAVIIIADQDVKNPPSNTFNVVRRDINKTTFTNQLRMLDEMIKTQNILKSQLITLNREMSDVIGGVETQLLRVKHFYEQKMPRRFDEFKGFKLFSKYAAGENMGGEFFDLLAVDNNIFIMMSSTSSYLLSSSILQFFSEMKNNKIINEEAEVEFIEKVRSELTELNKSKKKEINTELLTCILDINSLELKGHVFGNYNLVSSNMSHSFSTSKHITANFDNAKFKMKLKRGERILLNSPGFIHNWDMSAPPFILEELVVNEKIKALDILDEVFFQLKKSSQSGLISHDASAIVLEVQKNVMVKM